MSSALCVRMRNVWCRCSLSVAEMTGRENFTLTAFAEQSRAEILTAFVKQFYSGTAYIPKEIICRKGLWQRKAT